MMGEGVFKSTCIACHQANGEGLPNVFPPLAGSDYLNQNKERAVNIVVNGLQKQVTVNGKNYNGIMPPQNLTNKQISAVLTYVYSQWGNSGKVVKEEEVGRASSKRVALGK
jgi:nitrite reductase (NO-forming)